MFRTGRENGNSKKNQPPNQPQITNEQQHEDDDDDDEVVAAVFVEEERELRRPYEVQTPTKYRQPLSRNRTDGSINSSNSRGNSNQQHLVTNASSLTNTMRIAAATTATATNNSSHLNGKVLQEMTSHVDIDPTTTRSLNRNINHTAKDDNNNHSRHFPSQQQQHQPIDNEDDSILTNTTQSQQKSSVSDNVTTTTTMKLPTTTATAATTTSSSYKSKSTTTTTHRKVVQDLREFQRPIELPHVTIRYVNVQQRSAFDQYHTLSTDLCNNIRQQIQNGHDPNRISPSIQYAHILNRIYHHPKVIRQIQFSPSTGIDADYHYHHNHRNSEVNNNNSNNMNDTVIRDGRYRSIDPTRIESIFRNYKVSPTDSNKSNDDNTATESEYLSKLPPKPRLSHQKYRLPFRVDVGFSINGDNANKDNDSSSSIQYGNELHMKQLEIRDETLWELVQVRIACVVSSFYFMTDDDVDADATDDDSNDVGFTTINSRMIEQYILPYAGRHLRSVLMETKEHRIKTRTTSNSKSNDIIVNQAATIEHTNKKRSNESKFAATVEPNPYSMLAPPYESSYSPSQCWRPRLFHDRPPGLRYCYVCPVSVHHWKQVDLLLRNGITIGGNERSNNHSRMMMGSLALYTLPPLSKRLLAHTKSTSGLPTAVEAASYHCTTKRNHCPVAYGKISEEFYFPIPIPPSSSMSSKENGSSSDTNRTAIFSYNVHDLVMETMKDVNGYYSSYTEPDSLYVVLRVYKASYVGLDSTKQEQFGQILEHAAFGLTKVYSKEHKQTKNMQWPGGQIKTIQLYTHRSVGETEASFLEHLWRTVHQKSFTEAAQFPSSFDIRDDRSSQSGQSDMRFFRSPNRSRTPPPPVSSHKNHSRSFSASFIDSPRITDHQYYTSPSIYGSAKIFISSLHMDFLQCLLSPSSNDMRTETATLLSPKQITDITGDFAIAVDSSCDETSAEGLTSIPDGMNNKRSSLTRLPRHVEKAGYSVNAGCHEVLYMPARPDRQYNLDDHTSLSRSILNFLYIYPRLIRLSSQRREAPETIECRTRYTMRIRILYIDNSDSGKTPSSIRCFRNRSSWDGSSLLDHWYTNLIESTNSRTLEAGITVDDEIRIHLPDTLDRHYKIEFTLFAIDSQAESEFTAPSTLKIIARALIPLTSTKSNESATSIRVATVVPNGNHRLELGEFQFHFETRLISSIHTCDPFVATTIQNSSLVVRNQDYVGSLDIVTRIGSSSSAASAYDVSSKINKGMAPTCAVASFFHVMIYLQLHNIINATSLSFVEAAENMKNLATVMTKLKSYISMRSILFKTAFGFYIRSYLDLFDESCFFESDPLSPSIEIDDYEIEPIISELHGSECDEFEFGFIETHVETKSGFKENHLQRRLSRRRRNVQGQVMLDNAVIPFSRVAFAANKIEYTSATAGLRNERGIPTHFYDDDETIMTAPSIYSTRNSIDIQTFNSASQKNHRADAAITVINSFDENSIMRPANSPTNTYTSGSELMNRVRTAAAIMLAPCVAPSLASVLKSPQTVTATTRNTLLQHEKNYEPNVFTRTARCLCSPGSDIDDDTNVTIADDNFLKQRQEPKVLKSIRERLLNGSQQITLEERKKGNTQPSTIPSSLYESLIRAILKGCADGDSLSLNSQRAPSQLTSNSLTEQNTDSKVHDFFLHIDFILPLCLKSIVLRHHRSKSRTAEKSRVGECEIRLIKDFVALLARNLVYQGMETYGSLDDREESVQRALTSSHVVMDFIVGLTCVFTSKDIEVLLLQYFQSLRDFDAVINLIDHSTTDPVIWNDKTYYRSKCSRLLRLAAAETLSTLPSFLAINLPIKYSSEVNKGQKGTWFSQYVENFQGSLASSGKASVASSTFAKSGWLANIVINECFLVCTSSYKCFVDESTVLTEYVGNGDKKLTLANRNGKSLSPRDLVECQACAMHSITIIYELVVRRHLLDSRFQSESTQRRIAGLFSKTILTASCVHVSLLERLQPANQVRVNWLLCFIYVLQESPESLTYDYIRNLCGPKDFKLPGFIRLLTLSFTTFQHILRTKILSAPTLAADHTVSTWLYQEMYNTLCATLIVVVDVTVETLPYSLQEKNHGLYNIVELLLQVISVPQSPVTQLRAVGAAILLLEVDVELFLKLVDVNLEHWIRMMLTLMNSQSLSVRSIAVDFVVSLLSGIYKLHDNINEISMIIATILPEVIAREIGLYCLSGHVSTMEDVAKSVWPMRRAMADIGDANPLDDDRVNDDLSAIILPFSRACQAIIDGVLIEMRLRRKHLHLVGVKVTVEPTKEAAFDSDEESLFEAASFFVPEAAPLQRIRWLFTLQKLHTTRNYWVEASECLFLAAKALFDSIPHLMNLWRPTKYDLWSSNERSIWRTLVRPEKTLSQNGDNELMAFFDYFLEPSSFLGISLKQSVSIKDLSEILSQIVELLVEYSNKETGYEHLYIRRLQSLLELISIALQYVYDQPLTPKVSARMRQAEDEQALQKVATCIHEEMMKLSEHSIFEKRVVNPSYVIVRVHGKKSARFVESTTIPTFLEWNKWCVCRIPENQCVDHDNSTSDNQVEQFAAKYVDALRVYGSNDTKVVLRTNISNNEIDTAMSNNSDNISTYMDVLPVQILYGNHSISKQRFVYEDMIEIMVTNEFPCALSRQRSLEVQ